MFSVPCVSALHLGRVRCLHWTISLQLSLYVSFSLLLLSLQPPSAHTRMQVHACKPCLGARCQSWISFFRWYPSCFERQGLSWGTCGWSDNNTRDLPVCISQWENYRHMLPCSTFSGSCGLNPGPRVCEANALLIELFPQLQNFAIFFLPSEFAHWFLQNIISNFFFIFMFWNDSLQPACVLLSRKMELQVPRWES